MRVDADPTDPDLFSYAIVRKDLKMPAGKLASQAGHALRLCQNIYLARNAGALDAFLSQGHVGSIGILQADNERKLKLAHEQALAAGFPCFLFSDEGHILPPFFDGSPVVTCLGIGPARKLDMREITRRFQCVS